MAAAVASQRLPNACSSLIVAANPSMRVRRSDLNSEILAESPSGATVGPSGTVPAGMRPAHSTAPGQLVAPGARAQIQLDGPGVSSAFAHGPCSGFNASEMFAAPEFPSRSAPPIEALHLTTIAAQDAMRHTRHRRGDRTPRSRVSP